MKALTLGLFLLSSASVYAADPTPAPAGEPMVQTTKLVEPKEVPNENLFVRVKDTYRREAKQLISPKT